MISALNQKNEDSFNIKSNLPRNREIIVIESGHFFSSLNPRSFWQYRELFYFLSMRDVKIRYKQTLLGIAWVSLQPIITTVIFTTIFGTSAFLVQLLKKRYTNIARFCILVLTKKQELRSSRQLV